MNSNKSVAMINAPEFINLQENALNPGLSQCEIKVLYLGKNRNGSFIDKNVAIKMANTLPGAPIVGAWKEDIEDFSGHGEVIQIEDGEIKFSCKTIPYGFVAPDAQIWFQKFKDFDEFGNEIERDYMMTTGYLWTGQYPEVAECISSGKGQSMELNGETIKGHWAEDNNSGIEFFIINDAEFTKLCILGDDVEPCFEGAAVTSPDVSKNFTKDENFARTLFSMMNELKFALQNKGGSDMPEEKDHQLEAEEIEEVIEEAVEVDEEAGEADEEFACGDKKKKYAEDKGGENTEGGNGTEGGDSGETPGGGDTEEPETPETTDPTPTPTEPEEEEKIIDDGDSTSRSPRRIATSSLEVSVEEYEQLKANYAALEAELEALRSFKLAYENAQKDELIKKYFMLSDEDKAEIIANKEQYSLDEIESKLALIYVKKNVDFSTLTGETEEENVEEEDPISTFSLEDDKATGFVPDYVAALRQVKQEKSF